MRERERQETSPLLVHVFPSFARGGQQMRLASLVRGLEGAFRHRIVSLDGDTSAADAFPAGSIEVERFAARKSPGLSPSTIRGLARRISGADVLCTYNFGALEAAIANRVGPKLPHIHFEDGFGPDEALSRQKLKRVFLRRAVLGKSLVVVPSRGLERLAVETWRLKRANVRRIVNGVDVARFAGAPRRREAGTPVIVGSLGALRPEKNYARLIRAFEAAVSGAAARLVIYGEGPEREALSALAARTSGAVELRGETRTPEAAYTELDIFALSSDTEQAPLSLMEAMAAGLPAAATDVGDVRGMVAEENREFVTAPGDEDALAGALARLIGDADLRARLSAANAEKARGDFGLERMIADYRALFLEALRRGAP